MLLSGGYGHTDRSRCSLDAVLYAAAGVGAKGMIAAGMTSGTAPSGGVLAALVGGGDAMCRLRNTIERIAPSDVSVLIAGETGTGKEVAAETIHRASARADGPFETVDCGALSPALIASELFGHERGAFTGAERTYVGAFERADGGTLFLDEVGEIPLALQPALLGVLERRRFRRVGGEHYVSVDVRVVGASNRDLRGAVREGDFRQDLFYRLAVLLLRLPPLRERVEDIPALVHHFLESSGYRGPVAHVVAPAVMSALERHDWPGNVRELKNFVSSALAVGEAPPLDLGADPPPEPRSSDDPVYQVPRGLPYDRTIRKLQRCMVEDAMNQAGGVVSRAARILGIERTRLSKIRQRLSSDAP